MRSKIKERRDTMIAINEKRLGNLNSKLANTHLEKLKKEVNISPEDAILAYTAIFQARFEGYLESIVQSSDTDFREDRKIDPSQHLKLIEFLTAEDIPSIEAFAQAKYLLDRMFLEVTHKGNLKYVYNPKYLLTSLQLQKELDVSRSTVYRYMQRGMEFVGANTRSKFPLHNVFYWQHTGWIMRLQVINQAFQLRNRTEEEVINDLKAGIQKFESKYRQTFEELDKKIEHPDDLGADSFDYTEWKSIVEELKKYDTD